MGLIRRHSPFLFQSKLNRPSLFEGWYFKFATNPGLEEKESCAFIPGISTDPADPHAFIQYIDGHRAISAYARYPLAAFSWTDEPFCIQIGDSRFTRDRVDISIESSEILARGSITNSPWTVYPSRPFQAGIMGPFGLPGFLECYHGIVSASHEIQGKLDICVPGQGSNGTRVLHNMDQGRGYIEKDWGSSFPRDYIWLQANSFPQTGLSVFCSIASIPFKGMEFPGLIAFVHIPGQGFQTFATWNGAKVRKLEHGSASVDLELNKGAWTLKIQAKHQEASPLFAPRAGAMNRIIKESVDAQLDFQISKSGTVLAQGSSGCAGFESSGKLERLANWTS